MSEMRQMPPTQGLDSLADLQLTLTTLGAAELSCVRDGQSAEPILGPGKPLALIVYLVLSPRRTASRDHLTGLLWADSEPERASHALRQTLWHIGRLVNGRLLESRNGDIELTAPIVTDCERFIEAVHAAEFERAVANYAGEFLPGLAIPGGSAFEQWADLERIRLRTAFLRSAESLTRHYLGEGRVREAQRLARRARDADRLNEPGWRLLLETLIAGDDWTAAAMEADALAHLLEEEEFEPEPATRDTMRRARQMPPSESHEERHGLVGELVGREREFATIVGAWMAAKEGRARHVHVVAAAGLGKTRLLKDARARIRAAGTRAVYLRAHPGERAIPFTCAAELAGALAVMPGAAAVSPGAAATLVGLSPSLSIQYPTRPDHVGSGDVLRHRIEALTELLGAVSEESPVALLIDDLHWADPDSLSVFTALAARLDGLRVLLVSATRPTREVKLDAADTTVLHLGPLSERLVAQLVGSIATLPEEPWAGELPRRLTQASRGSPLLVLELLQHALESDILAFEAGAWTCRDPAALLGALAADSALRRRLDEQDPLSRILLLTLALAGTPLSLVTLAHAAARAEDVIEPLLVTLEERGLVTRLGSVWEIAHDELAALLLDRAASGTVEVARRALGNALALDSGNDPALARQAALLLATAGEDAALARVYRAWLARRRGQGDKRAPRDVAEELLGEMARADRVRNLVASLPLPVRFRLDTGRRRLALGLPLIAAAAIATLLLIRPETPLPDAALFAFPRTSRGDAAWHTELRRASWADDRALRLQPARSVAPLVSSALASSAWPTRSPEGDSWIFERTFPDSGGMDLVRWFDDGRPEVRLTFSPADDGAPSWAPDGSAIAFTTMRWNELNHSDVAILHLRDNAVRQLTSGDAGDGYPRWSPDGTRIAFGRGTYGMGRNALCVIRVDGGALRCFPFESRRAPIPLGWRDANRVVFDWDSLGTVVRGVIDTESGERTRLTGATGGVALLSPDGAWMLWHDTEHVSDGRKWYVWPLDDESARRVVGDEQLDDIKLVWDAVPRQPTFLDRIRISPMLGTIPLTAGWFLALDGFDPIGRAATLNAVTWRSADSAIAIFDTSGVLLPRQPGRVWIHVSVGGWRRDSIQVEISESKSETVRRESWLDGFAEAWVAFGEPRPEVLELHDTAAALWTRGDSSYNSGVYSRFEYSAQEGLGVEARVSGRVTQTQWQSYVIAFHAAMDETALTNWDHRAGGMPYDGGPICTIMYPAREGTGGAEKISLGCLSSYVEVPAPPSLRQGALHRLRLQLLPDGRAGLAIDGVPTALTPTPIPLERPFRLVLSGQSHNTQLLIGEVEVWTGLRGDVDWRVLDATPNQRN